MCFYVTSLSQSDCLKLDQDEESEAKKRAKISHICLFGEANRNRSRGRGSSQPHPLGLFQEEAEMNHFGLTSLLILASSWPHLSLFVREPKIMLSGSFWSLLNPTLLASSSERQRDRDYVI